MSAVFGNDLAHLVINTPSNIFNSPMNASWNASGVNPAFLAFFPDLADDSYATIGLEGPAATSGLAGAADPSLVEDSALSPSISGYFLSGGVELNVNTLTGGSWYVLNTAANALPDADGRWLIAQITTAGSISGTMNYQVFPLGVGADQVQVSMDFDGAGTFGGGSDIVCGCMDDTACNYDAAATNDDGSCVPDRPLERRFLLNDADGVDVVKTVWVVPTTWRATMTPLQQRTTAAVPNSMSAVCVAVKALLTAHATVTATFSTSAVCVAVKASLTAHATVTATLLIAVANAVVMALLALVSA